jgi:uncharacterized protein YjbI with pentapeptide repeats
MANPEHVDLVRQGPVALEQWRQEHPNELLDLYEADLDGVDLSGARLVLAGLRWASLVEANLSKAELYRGDLFGANLTGAHLHGASLEKAELVRANLTGADLTDANLCAADLGGATLTAADLTRADCFGAHLSGANLSRATLTQTRLDEARLVGTNLTGARLHACTVYGIIAWDVQLEGATQAELTLTPWDQPPIIVDDLEVAQLLCLLLYNPNVRRVLNSFTPAPNIVLVLGHFPFERKAVLDAVRAALRKTARGYIPVTFDFEAPSNRTPTETISTLARVARFIIVDLTDPRAIPADLASIVPTLATPVVPLLQAPSQPAYIQFESLRKYPWVLPVYRYRDAASLVETLADSVISPAEQKATELHGDRLT